jgi:hypothetical protein
LFDPFERLLADLNPAADTHPRLGRLEMQHAVAAEHCLALEAANLAFGLNDLVLPQMAL